MLSWTNPPPAPGVLRPENVGSVFDLRVAPPPDRLAPYVERFWSVRWNLRVPQPQPSQVISYPSVHLTAEAGPDRYGHRLPGEFLHGVTTRRFDLTLVDQGYSYGVRFTPGGFTALTGRAVHSLTDRVEVVDLPDLARVHVLHDDDERLATLVAAVDRLRTTDADGPLEVVAALVADIRDSGVTTLAEIAPRHALSERTVQRLLRDDVGVGVRWLIRRCRLHDALDALHAEPSTPIAALAARLGWYDQAHFTRDFKAAAGISPAAYARRPSPPG